MTFFAGCTWTISCDGIQLRHSLGLGSNGTFSPQHASSLRGLVWAELPLRVATVSQKGKTPAQEQLIQYLLATHLLITSDWDSSLAKFRAGELIPQGCASGEVWLTEQHWWNSLQQSVLWPRCFTPFFNAKYAHALTRPHPQAHQVITGNLKSRISWPRWTQMWNRLWGCFSLWTRDLWTKEACNVPSTHLHTRERGGRGNCNRHSE